MVAPTSGSSHPSTTPLTITAELVDLVPSDALWELAASVDGRSASCRQTPIDIGARLECTADVATAEGAVSVAVSGTGPDGEALLKTVAISVVPNGPTQITWLAPDDTAVLREGQTVSVRARFEDSDGLEPRAIEWTGQAHGHTVDILEDGVVGTEIILPAESLGIGLRVVDGWGHPSVAEATWAVGPANRAPTCGITNPVDGARVSGAVPLMLTANTADSDDPGGALLQQWASDLDGNLGDGQEVILSRGVHVLSYTVTDPWGAMCSDIVVVEVNAPPALATVTLTPSLATTHDALTCAAIQTYDPDGDDVSVRYAWLVDGVSIPAGQLLSSSATSPGDVVRCTATPNDGFEDGPSMSDEVVIQYEPPMAESIEITPQLPVTTDRLQCMTNGFQSPSAGSDVSEVTWTVNGVEVHTGRSLASSETTRGDEVTCTVALHDGLASGDTFTSSVRIQNAVPTGAARVRPASPVQGDILTCEAVQVLDADDDDVTTSIVWTLDGAALDESERALLIGDALDSTEVAGGRMVACSIALHDGTDAVGLSADAVELLAPPELTIDAPRAFDVVRSNVVDVWGDAWLADTVAARVGEGIWRPCMVADDAYRCDALPLSQGSVELTVRASNGVGDTTQTVDFTADPYGCLTYPSGPYFVDDDGDGFGTDVTVTSCGAGTAPESGDCDDSDAGVNPGRTSDSFRNGVDDDCNGYTDELFVETQDDVQGLSWAEGLRPLTQLVVFSEGIFDVEEILRPGVGVRWQCAGRPGLCKVRVREPIYVEHDGVVIEGMTMDGRGRPDDPIFDNRGGVLHVEGGSIELISSVIMGGLADYGGGAAVRGDGSLTGRNVTFWANRAAGIDGFPGYGGGMYVEDGEVDLVGVLFMGQFADHAGAISMEHDASQVALTNALFLATGYRFESTRSDHAIEVRRGNLQLTHATFADSRLTDSVIEVRSAGTVDARAVAFADDTYTISGAGTVWHGWNLVPTAQWQHPDLDFTSVGPLPLVGTPTFEAFYDDIAYNDDFRLVPGTLGADAGPPGGLDADGSAADIGCMGGPEAYLVPLPR